MIAARPVGLSDHLGIRINESFEQFTWHFLNRHDRLSDDTFLSVFFLRQVETDVHSSFLHDSRNIGSVDAEQSQQLDHYLRCSWPAQWMNYDEN